MAVDLKPWVEELYKTGSLSDEEKKVLDTVFAKEPVAKFVGESTLRQSDYSRKLNEMTAKEQKLASDVEAKQAALDAHEASLIKWKDEDVVPKVNKLAQELEDAKLALFKHQRAVTKAQEAYNITPQELGLDDSAPVKTAEKEPAPTFDSTKYVSREEYDKILAETQRVPFITEEMQDIADDYQELFGKPLRGRTALLSEAVAAHRKDPTLKLRNYIEQKFEFQKRREEVSQERQKDHDAKIRAEERSKVLSEYKMPVTRPAPDQMPQLPKPSEIIGKEQSGRNRDASSLEEIVQVYNAGKYKEARPGSA